MLEYFLIFQDRKNVVEHNCYLEGYKCHIIITHTHTYHQWHTHVYQTWQQVNDLNLRELRKGRFPGNSSWRPPQLHHLGSHCNQDPHVRILTVKPKQFSRSRFFACRCQLDPYIWAETFPPKATYLAWLFLHSFSPWSWRTIISNRISPVFSEQNWNMLLFYF